MKYLAVLVTALALAACGDFERANAKLTGYSKICVDGVTYLQFPSGATPQLNRDGKLVTCK